MSIKYHKKEELFSEAIKKILKSEIVLDIGCGIMPQKLIKPRVHICLDPFEQYVQSLQKKLKKEDDRSYILIKSTWEEAIKIFPPKSIDTVFLLDVVEHLDKKIALKLLKKTEDIARVQIVVFTPLGFLKQIHKNDKDAWGLKGGKWQMHKSGWYPNDFDDSWNLFIAKKFHYETNLGKKYDKPYGAFIAVKDIYKSHYSNYAPSFSDKKYIKLGKELLKTKQEKRNQAIKLKNIYKSRTWKIIQILSKLKH